MSFSRKQKKWNLPKIRALVCARGLVKEDDIARWYGARESDVRVPVIDVGPIRRAVVLLESLFSPHLRDFQAEPQLLKYLAQLGLTDVDPKAKPKMVLVI